ncbi:MAG: hypothetical protein K0R68_57 [Mycobacterium sp.]|nr:hypothetical protein [Mycobacterium sp.]
MSNRPGVGPCFGGNQVQERIRGNQVRRLHRIDRHCHRRVRCRRRRG